MQSFSPEQAPEYVVIRDNTSFFRDGPMQAGGADLLLLVGERVKILRREMGYSLVQLDSLRTGYVANEDMAVAPKLPPKKKSSSTSEELYTGEQVNDVPLPDPAMPPLDLNVAPEEVPTDGEKPAESPSPTP